MMTEQQKHMLQQALEALSNAYCEKKKYYIAVLYDHKPLIQITADEWIDIVRKSGR